ncbi:hypothetical protein CSW53_12175 [Rhodococcus ruber]|nr:hypothetical protein CSW53_12175 [Rhodococcus ruber]
MSRSTISEIERGRRKSVNTAELCVIAWALDVPPVRLLYPDLPDGPVEVVPGVEVSSTAAMSWFGGEMTFEPEITPELKDELPESEWLARLQRATAVSRGAELVRLSRERIRLESEIRSHGTLIARMRAADEQDFADQLMQDVVFFEKQLEAVNKQLLLREDATTRDVAGAERHG